MSSKEMAGEVPAQRLKTNKGRSRRVGCEGTTEEDKEDVDDEADAEKAPSVLWEKHFQQSIFVDISDDDSLHLSDLQGSFRVHISQGVESENTGLSDSYGAEEDSSESSVSISRDMKGNKSKASGPQPNRAPERPRRRHEDDNTSDEDQEELPYDGELQHHHTLNTKSPIEKSKEPHTVNSDVLNTISKPSGNVEKVNGGVCYSDQPVVECLQVQEPGRITASVPEFLLRHFSQDELLNCGRLIEAETMPEVSLLDSIDETARSRASPNPYTTGVGGHSAKLKASLSLLEEDVSSRGRSHTASETNTDSKTGSARTTADRNKNTDEIINHSSLYNPSDSTVEFRPSCSSNMDSCPGSSAEDEREEDEENAEQSCSASTPNLTKADIHIARFSLGRTRSCSELKYGQGQVHYPLPDFSKVAPKVKIPKGNGPTKPGCHTPSIDRTHATTPGILVKPPTSCTADVISRVLEDSVWLGEMRKDEEKQARLDQLLQAEYDRLLAKYADNDNGRRTQASIERSPSTHCRETADVLDITQGQPRAVLPTSQSTLAGLFEGKKDAGLRSLSEQQSMTDGQRLTTELTTIIHQFMEKMKEFQKCISTMSMTVEEQQKMFKSMMEAQDQLERNYMNKKEEHRVLEMQNYMGLERNTGQFDPDRQVEGEIFRLGMQLEDIKEQIDRNASCMLSPPPVSSTPIPSRHAEFIPSSSRQPHRHEESVFSFPASSQSTVEEEEHSCTTEVVDEEPRAAEAPLSCPSDTSFRTSGQTSCTSRDDEEGSASVQGEVDDHEDFLAQFTEQVSSEHQRTSDRPEDVGSHTEESPEQQINKAQRLVSPETDSGFSTSDMSRPPTGLSHTPRNPESSSPSDDVNSMSSMSASDNEAFHSNLHTVIPWAGWSKMGESEPDPLPNYAQNMQENYTTQNSPAGLHIAGEAPLCSREGATLHTAQLQEPSQEEHSVNIQRPTASETPTRDKQSPCSCPNNEAISALRYEVSRLKKVLEESLGYLPHLSMRMDHLSNMYTQEKRLRSRTRLRHQHRPPSKGTDSGESDHSERPVSFSPTYIHYHSRPSSSTRLHDLKCSSTAASLESLSQDRSQSKPRNNHRRASVEPSSPGGSVSIGPSSHSSDVSIGPVSYNRRASVGYTRHSSKVSIESTTSGSRTSAGAVSHGYRPPGENVCLKDRYLSPHLLHKPLLQTGYGSCNSLPPSFKVRDQQSDSEVSSRRRTTQSDSAMLPSNVYFQRTSPLPASACRTRGRPWRQKISKCGQEEAINRSLDKALEAALLMKQTTDRMAKTLSTDLAKTRTYRKLHGIHPEQPRLERSPALNVHHTLH